MSRVWAIWYKKQLTNFIDFFIEFKPTDLL